MLQRRGSKSSVFFFERLRKSVIDYSSAIEDARKFFFLRVRHGFKETSNVREPTVAEINEIVVAELEFFFPEGGVGLVPKRGCLLTLAYYAFPR
jgi:hypothetical protein